MFGLINLYITDKILLAYYYTQPKSIDNQLLTKALRIIRYAPFFMFSLGYWAVGNRQMLYNELRPLTNEFDNVDPGHINYIPRELDHTIFHLIMLLAFGVRIIMQDKYTKEPSNDLAIDEGIGSFYQSLKGTD